MRRVGKGGRGAERALDNRRAGRKSLVLVAMDIHDYAGREWHVVSRKNRRRNLVFRPLRGRGCSRLEENKISQTFFSL